MVRQKLSEKKVEIKISNDQKSFQEYIPFTVNPQNSKNHQGISLKLKKFIPLQ